MQLLHQFRRDAAPCRYSRPEILEPFMRNHTMPEELQLSREHSWHTIEGGALFLLDRLQCEEGVERFGREDDRGS